MGHAPFESVKCGQESVNEDSIKGSGSLTAAETFIMSGCKLCRQTIISQSQALWEFSWIIKRGGDSVGEKMMKKKTCEECY